MFSFVSPHASDFQLECEKSVVRFPLFRATTHPQLRSIPICKPLPNKSKIWTIFTTAARSCERFPANSNVRKQPSGTAGWDLRFDLFAPRLLRASLGRRRFSPYPCRGWEAIQDPGWRRFPVESTSRGGSVGEDTGGDGREWSGGCWGMVLAGGVDMWSWLWLLVVLYGMLLLRDRKIVTEAD